MVWVTIKSPAPLEYANQGRWIIGPSLSQLHVCPPLTSIEKNPVSVVTLESKPRSVIAVELLCSAIPHRLGFDPKSSTLDPAQVCEVVTNSYKEPGRALMNEQQAGIPNSSRISQCAQSRSTAFAPYPQRCTTPQILAFG